MAIKRYIANSDTTITNAFEANLKTRGTGSNMGASDILEVFSIYGQVVSGSNSTKTSELSRILINFPISDISTDRANGDIPASGSVNFLLKMFNAEHSSTVPESYTLSASAVTKDWEEGFGLDMEGYTDITKEGTGVTWMHASSGGTSWTRPGGDYDATFTSSFEQTFSKGREDLEMNVTTLVEQWLSSSANDKSAVNLGDKSSARYGFGIFLTSSQEGKYTGTEEKGVLANPTGSTRSYYTKRFYGRGTEHFFKRPAIEARWDDSKKDHRGNFYLSSSLAPASDNLMKLYLYNFVRGQLANIPGLGGPNSGNNVANTKLLVSIYSGSSANTAPSGVKLNFSVGGGTSTAAHNFTTASWFATGSYSASFAFTGSTALTRVFDVWHSASTEYFTGSAISINTLKAHNNNPNPRYAVSMPSLRSAYSDLGNTRFRVHTRKKDWSPTIYTKASNVVEIDFVEDAYYKIYRVKDDSPVINYGTGSLNHTRLSYDASGSYFDLDTSMLEKGYMYGVKYVFYENGKYVEQSDTFKFRVE